MNQLEKALITNLFGGPHSAKSTTAAGVFYQLKKRDISCEMVPEYAKVKLWEESLNTLNDQNYVFAKQNHKIFDLVKKVDVIVTDSPLLISLIYGKQEPDSFKQLVQDKHHSHKNLNFYLNRPETFDQTGRLQNKEQSIEIDHEVLNMLKKHNIPYISVDVNEDTVDIVTKKIIKQLVKKH